ncbi:MAG: demethylmenaquinone methyltransferase / 2-methoxy-6-polyprenyl,4-benzoquinol methylase, partial [Chloroflexia bacterium]|nr:demethylmenaquinone methyltransferase / 2-methoxy-6-polyprenyl,4-benzoquinol methylase [Chloroflexia bacterium]
AKKPTMTDSPTAISDATMLALSSAADISTPRRNPDASLSGVEKARYVKGMFGRIAWRYDLMNRIMSFGQDAMWRRYTVDQAQPTVGGLALDVATGTGRIAQELAGRGMRVVGIDLTVEMMLQGRKDGVGSNEPVYFAGGDALSLPFPDDTFDCVTTGFAMRNVVDIEGAFREMRRVLKPGGRLVCLEVGRPKRAIYRLFHRLHTRFVVPLLGRVVVGDTDAYSYLPSSMGKFPPPAELARIMRKTGLRNVRYRQLTFGAVAVHRGTK